MELYIARNKYKDEDGELFMYNNKPVRVEDAGLFLSNENSEDNDIDYNGIEIDPELFPEVTWENSPKKVELKLI